MGDAVKLLLSNELKALEEGAFQDFCLIFLPKFDSRYEGLERHGGTAGGKTRAGNPDLIRTDLSGNQIAVECSAQKDYWRRPKDISKWKPYSDAVKCIDDLPGLSEIVLCSNQEIPTTQADTKRELRKLLKEKTSADVFLLSISNFEEELLDQYKKYAQVISLSFPRTSRFLLEQEEEKTASLTLRL